MENGKGERRQEETHKKGHKEKKIKQEIKKARERK
jgi:hypothetical protein